MSKTGNTLSDTLTPTENLPQWVSIEDISESNKTGQHGGEINAKDLAGQTVLTDGDVIDVLQLVMDGFKNRN